MRNTHRIIVIAVLPILWALPITQAHSLTLLGKNEKKLATKLVDRDQGTDIKSAFFVVREFTTYERFHGSSTFCFRGTVAASIDGQWALARLLELGWSEAKDTGADSSDYLEVTAYSPGYCAVQTSPGKDQSLYLSSYKGPSKHWSGRPLEIIRGSALTLKTVPHADPAEWRILYLTDLVYQMTCSLPYWQESSDAEMASAMVQEASAIARTPYEKYLVDDLKLALENRRTPTGIHAMKTKHAWPAPPRPPVNIIIAPAGTVISWGQGSELTIVAAHQGTIRGAGASSIEKKTATMRAPSLHTSAKSAAKMPIQPAAPTEKKEIPPLHIFCRFGDTSKCDLNERDSDGATLLARIVEASRLEELKVLMDAGADPDIARAPGGATPLDGILNSVLNYNAAYYPKNSDRLFRAARVMDVLIGSGKATLSAKIKDQLQSDPESWSIRDQEAKQFFLDARVKLAKLPTRSEFLPSCPREVEPNRFVLKNPDAK